MQLLYDPRDEYYHRRLGSRVLDWLDHLDACPLPEADPAESGSLFAGARPVDDHRDLVAEHPLVRDRPDEREPLLRLVTVLIAVVSARVAVPSPPSWVLPLEPVMHSEAPAWVATG